MVFIGRTSGTRYRYPARGDFVLKHDVCHGRSLKNLKQRSTPNFYGEIPDTVRSRRDTIASGGFERGDGAIVPRRHGIWSAFRLPRRRWTYLNSSVDRCIVYRSHVCLPSLGLASSPHLWWWRMTVMNDIMTYYLLAVNPVLMFLLCYRCLRNNYNACYNITKLSVNRTVTNGLITPITEVLVILLYLSKYLR